MASLLFLWVSSESSFTVYFQSFGRNSHRQSLLLQSEELNKLISRTTMI